MTGPSEDAILIAAATLAAELQRQLLVAGITSPSQTETEKRLVVSTLYLADQLRADRGKDGPQASEDEASTPTKGRMSLSGPSA